MKKKVIKKKEKKNFKIDCIKKSINANEKLKGGILEKIIELEKSIKNIRIELNNQIENQHKFKTYWETKALEVIEISRFIKEHEVTLEVRQKDLDLLKKDLMSHISEIYKLLNSEDKAKKTAVIGCEYKEEEEKL